MATNDSYVSRVGFTDIDDDCLWFTFQHLNFKEKVGVMRVNKRWRKVATHLIENESCLELKLMKKETETVTNNRKYADEESIKRNLFIIFGKEASFFNYKLEFVEQIRIIGLEGPSDLTEDTRAFRLRFSSQEASPTFNSRPLTLTDFVWLFKRFPQLKSLSLDHVEILDPMVPKSKKGQQLKDLPSRLKSLHLNSSSNFWVDSLIEKDNVLEELRLETKTFECLKPAKLPFLRAVSLKTSVPQLFNLITNSPDISEIRLHALQPDRKRGLRSYSLIPFMQLTQLKTLALDYDTKIDLFQRRSLEEEKALQYYLSTETDSLKFSNLRLFKLSNVFIEPQIFGDILSKMPTIKCLKLRNIYVECDCMVEDNETPCLSCPKEFVEYLPTLPNLSELHLNNNRDKDYNECVMASLAQIISDERLPKLRKLKCCLMDLFSPFLFEAFTNLAWKHPRESFAMIAPFDDQPNKAELLVVKPRNLETIHSRCTSKEVFLRRSTFY